MIWTSCKKTYLEAPETVDKQELLDLVNKVRENGCNCSGEDMPPVAAIVWNDTLTIVAQTHSDDMNSHNKLDHTGSDGSSPGDRLDYAGYNWTTYAENIAVGYTSEQAVIDGWLKSEGHCKNIMNANVTEMGVATSGSYWTQIFAAKK